MNESRKKKVSLNLGEGSAFALWCSRLSAKKALAELCSRDARGNTEYQVIRLTASSGLLVLLASYVVLH